MNRLSRHSRPASVMALSLMASCSITAAGPATADNPEGVSAPREPVKYRVKEKSLIGNDVHEAGATVSYAGLPSENLEPLCDEGRKRAAEYVESNAARVKAMVSAHAGVESPVGDPTKFMQAFAEELVRERAEHQAQIAQLVATNQAAALQLAEAAKNMATLAAAITAQPAAAGEAPAAQADVANSTATTGDTGTPATGEAKGEETGTTTVAKRTKG